MSNVVGTSNISFSELRTKLINQLTGTYTFSNQNIALSSFRGCKLGTNITLDSNYETTFTSSGTFTVPSGVTQVSAVCIGGVEGHQDHLEQVTLVVLVEAVVDWHMEHSRLHRENH